MDDQQQSDTQHSTLHYFLFLLFSFLSLSHAHAHVHIHARTHAQMVTLEQPCKQN